MDDCHTTVAKMLKGDKSLIAAFFGTLGKIHTITESQAQAKSLLIKSKERMYRKKRKLCHLFLLLWYYSSFRWDASVPI